MAWNIVSTLSLRPCSPCTSAWVKIEWNVWYTYVSLDPYLLTNKKDKCAHNWPHIDLNQCHLKFSHIIPIGFGHCPPSNLEVYTSHSMLYQYNIMFSQNNVCVAPSSDCMSKHAIVSTSQRWGFWLGEDQSTTQEKHIIKLDYILKYHLLHLI